MLKLFLLIPFFTLNVAMTLGLIYFTVFIDPEMGFSISLVVVIVIAVALVLVSAMKGDNEHGAG